MCGRGLFWCPGPESNRYGRLIPRDFHTRYSFHCPLRCLNRGLGSGLSLCPIVVDLGRSHQVSTLSPRVRLTMVRLVLPRGLARDCHHPGPDAEVSPNLTPFTPRVSRLGAQIMNQVPCVYLFRHLGQNKRRLV